MWEALSRWWWCFQAVDPTSPTNCPPPEQCPYFSEKGSRAYPEWNTQSLVAYEFVPCVPISSLCGFSFPLPGYHPFPIQCHQPARSPSRMTYRSLEVDAQSEWPAGTRNHTTTSPLSSTHLYFPFLFTSWLSYKTYLPQIFVSWMLIKCPQVKKYLEINYDTDTSVAYAHFHKNLKHCREAQWARLITVFSIKHWR